jgi:chromosome segregation ATPase
VNDYLCYLHLREYQDHKTISFNEINLTKWFEAERVSFRNQLFQSKTKRFMDDLISARAHLRMLQTQKAALETALAEMQSAGHDHPNHTQSKTIIDHWRDLEDENDALDSQIQTARHLSRDLSHQKTRNSGRLVRLVQNLGLARSRLETEVGLFKTTKVSVKLVQAKVTAQQEKQQQIASDIEAIRSDLRTLTAEIQEETRESYSLMQSRIEELQEELDEVKSEEDDLRYRLEELRHRKKHEIQRQQAVVVKARRVRNFQQEKFRLARELRQVSKLIDRERGQLKDTEDRELAVTRNASFS